MSGVYIRYPALGNGTVTSVALSAPSSILSVSGSPITGSGTLALSLATQTANTVWAGPTSGGAATPTFRAIVAADLPAGAVLSLGAVGSSPNANAASISGQVLTLQPADATNPGVVTTATQSFGGNKTFIKGASIVGSTDEVQLSIQGNATQTNNLIAVTTSGFTSLLTLNNSGNLAVGGTISAGGGQLITAGHYRGDNGNQATSGVYNLENTGLIAFRNAANSADLSLSLDGSNIFQFTSAVNITGNITASNLSGTNTGDVTLSAIGSTPNANGATLTGQALNLEPASASFGGIVTTGAQTFAGAKTFNSAPNLNSLTASLPLKLDISKNITAAAIDLSGSEVTSTLPIGNGGTGITTYTTGDLLYASATNTLSKLAAGTSGKALVQGASVPSWTTLGVSGGGTNSATALNNNRVMQSSGGAIVEAAAITASRALASDANGIPVASATTATELGYVSGVTSAIQTQLNAKLGSVNSYYRHDTESGNGSTNTCIRYWSNTTANAGSDITYASSSVNGDTWTINTAGTYGITYCDSTSAGGFLFGLSLNSNQLTTSIASITQANKLVITNPQSSNENSACSWIGYLAVNDVIRCHCDGSAASGVASRTMFAIYRIT